MTDLISSSWQNMASPPGLLPNSVHLWRFSLHSESMLNILSNDERQRAQRLRMPDKARGFAVGRSRLRQILSLYLNLPPEALVFEYNEHGKPFLSPGLSENLSFNLSHSGDWGLCAVRQGGEVGVDIEAVRSDLAVTSLAERYFTVAENSWLISSRPGRLRRNFYRLWTRKEAWLKGKGAGFSDLNLGLADAHTTGHLSEADGWQMMNLPIAKGYVGALAVEDKVEKVERFFFPGEFLS